MNKRILDIFLQLIKIEGLSGEERNVADYVRKFLAQLGLEPFEDDSYRRTNSNTGNIICKKGSGGNKVLVSHMDTAVTTKGVKPICRSDKITSDGTTVLGVDNRAGIAVLLAAVEEIVTKGIATKDFTLVFTTCEETTLGGSRNLKLEESISEGFVFDSFMRPGIYIRESLGAASFKIRIIGRAAHSGIAPERGINSIKIAAQAVAGLSLGRINESTTVNIGKISGGSSVNVIPEVTEVFGEVRSAVTQTADSSLENIRAEFMRAAESFGGGLEFSYDWDFMPYKLNSDSKVLEKIQTSIRRCGLNPTAEKSWGGSDANSLNSNGIEAVNIGIGAQNPHSKDEFILYEDLQRSFEIAMEITKC